jgi:O-antigen/teichoic acid export membrane protein
MLARSFTLNLLGAANTYALGFASAILLARLLGPSDRGLLGIQIAMVTFGYAFVGLGLPYSVEYHAGRRERPGALLGNSLLYGLVLAVVLIPATWLLHGQLADLVSAGHGGRQWILVGFLIPLTFLQWTALNQLAGTLRFGLYNVLFAASRVVYVAAMVVLLLSGLGVTAGLVAAGAASVVAIAAAYVVILRQDRLAFDGALYRRMLSYGARRWPGSLFQILNFRLDVIVLQFFRPLSAVGYYVVAQAVAELVNGVAIAFQSSVLPLISNDDDESGRARTTSSALRHQLILATAAVLVIAVLGPIVLLVGFGPAYRASLVPMLILLPGILLLNTGTVASASLEGRGRPGIMSTLSGASLVVTVVLDVVLIPWLGVTGAAIASLVAYSTYGVAALIVLGRISGTSPWRLVAPTRADLMLYPAAARMVWRRFTPFQRSANNPSEP